MSLPMDFGNGFIAHFSGLPGLIADSGAGRIEQGHYGFTSPTVEIAVTEYAIGDGGSFDGSRATSRRMRCTVVHREAWTRKQIQQAFTPGVQRTLSTALGSMPYYVEELLFPESLAESRYKFTVSLWSPLAYPLGAALSASIEGGGGYAAEGTRITQATDSGTATFTPDIGDLIIRQTFPGFSGMLTALEYTVKTAPSNPTAWRVGLARIDGTTMVTMLTVGANVAIGVQKATFPYPISVSAAQVYALVLQKLGGAVDIGLGYGASNPYAGGVGSAVIGTCDRTNFDLKFKVYGQLPDGGTGTVTFSADTDVIADCVVTCTMITPASSLVVFDGVRTTTITGALNINDVVVIDSAARTVTVNGVNRIAWFNRLGDWPRVTPGTNTFTITPAAATSISWQPRLMGLI